jgi:hypothetical protein
LPWSRKFQVDSRTFWAMIGDTPHRGLSGGAEC